VIGGVGESRGWGFEPFDDEISGAIALNDAFVEGLEQIAAAHGAN
jgi:hypothetical protein